MRHLRFNQGFALHSERLSGFVRCVAEQPLASKEDVAAYIGVNPYMIEGLMGWLYKTGLGKGNSRNYALTPFGTLVAKHDPQLQRMGTLWLLHYYLCSEHEERAEVWFRCFNAFLTFGQTFSADELRTFVEGNLEHTPTNTKGVESDTKELLRTYTQSTGLGDLGLLAKRGESFEVLAPRTPEPLIVAYVLFDSWARHFGSADVVRLSQLVSEPESIGRIFVAAPGQVRALIVTLQGLGLVNYADTQHEPVTRRYEATPIDLLERYYREQ